MDGFKSEHVTVSKKLKSRKNFKSKVKNLLRKRVTKDGVPIQEQLNLSQLGVQRVDASSLKKNLKTLNRHKFIKVQFINDVTSKILQSVNGGPFTQEVPVTLREISKENNTFRSKMGVESSDEATNASSDSDFNLLQKKPAQQSHVKPLIKGCISTEKFTVTNYTPRDIPVGSNAFKSESGAKFFEEAANVSTTDSDFNLLEEKPVQQYKVNQFIDSCISTEKFTVTAQTEHTDGLIGNIDDEVTSSRKRVKQKLKKQANSEKCNQAAVGASIYDILGKETIQFSSNMNHREEREDKQHKMRPLTEVLPLSLVSNNSVINTSEVSSISNKPNKNALPKTCYPETTTQETNFVRLEPLVIESDSENAIKEVIIKRLENATRNAIEGSISTAQISCSMKKVLYLNISDECQSTPTCTVDTKENSDDRMKPKVLVTKRFQSLSTEETPSSDMSALRGTLQTFSTAQARPQLVDNVAADLDELNIDFYTLPNDRFILVLRNGSPVYVRGSVTISVIAGCAEILGSKLIPEAEPKKYTIYSPRGVSLLPIQPCTSNNLFIDNNAVHSLCSDSHPYEYLINSLEERCDSLRHTLQEKDCMLLLQKTESRVVEYMNLHMPNKLFPSSASLMKLQRKYSFAEKLLECEFLPKNIDENVKLFCKKEEWDRLSDVVMSRNNGKGSNCTVICGGKGVGKSTLLRFLINRSLAFHQKVLCLDFDLGQAEFTMPGCISVVIVDKPLLGPNFTHLLRPERMIFLGDVNVGACLSTYLKGMKDIIEYCKSKEDFKNIPWFVNTMGYIHGLGVELIMNLVHMISPSDVVQIQSRNNKRNFACHLEAPFVQKYKSSLRSITFERSKLSYNLHVIPSAAESNSTNQEPEWGLDARTMRNIVIMAYLSTIGAPPYFNLTAVVPVVCSFENLQLCISHETVHPNKILSVMNGNLVALCVSEEEDVLQPSDPTFPRVLSRTPVCCCLGFGIVRGADKSEKRLYIISPLSTTEMQRINCLVMGSVQIPSYVLLSSATAGAVGHIPYTVIGPGQPTGRLSMKSPFNLVLSSVA